MSHGGSQPYSNIPVTVHISSYDDSFWQNQVWFSVFLLFLSEQKFILAPGHCAAAEEAEHPQALADL